MILIHGISNSGKSTKALSLVKKDVRCNYYVLDSDKSIKSNNEELLKIRKIKNCSIIDIEFDILQDGGLMTNNIKQVVIDSVNFIHRLPTQSIISILNRIKNLEISYNIEVICTLNQPLHFKDSKIFNLDKIDFIETKTKKFKSIEGKGPKKKVSIPVNSMAIDNIVNFLN